MRRTIVNPADAQLEQILLGELNTAFSSLPQNTVVSLKETLQQIDPFNAQPINTLAQAVIEGTKIIGSLIQDAKCPGKIAPKIKNELELSAKTLEEKLVGRPDHKTLLPDLIKVRAVCKSLHDGFHTKGRGYIAPEASVHTAIHAVGQLVMVVTFLPELRFQAGLQVPDFRDFLPKSFNQKPAK